MFQQLDTSKKGITNQGSSAIDHGVDYNNFYVNSLHTSSNSYNLAETLTN